MNGVTIKRQNGGLARTLAGSDHVSALLVYGVATAVLPRLVLSPEDLETNGITVTDQPVLHYHVDEFFRINPGAKLYIQAEIASDGTYSEIKTLQSFAGGDIRQVGICDFTTPSANIAARVAKLEQVAKELADVNVPLSVLASFKTDAAGLLALPTLHDLKSERVSVIVAQDAGGRGGYLSATYPSIGTIGTALGATSKAKVHESIAWVENQNLVSTAYEKTLTGNEEKARELDVPGFTDGSKISDYTPQQLQSISDKGYIFCVKYTGNAGTYFNDSFTATDLTDDYAYLENNRTIDKAVRGINRVLLPKVSGPAYIDPDTGKLEYSTVSALEAICDEVLDQMQRDGEISGYAVNIDPNQQVLRTSKLEVVVKLIPVGTMREILVKIGLTLQK